ncbi:MAG TPA: NACHT domain-containing protein [Micromonospora sp.]
MHLQFGPDAAQLAPQLAAPAEAERMAVLDAVRTTRHLLVFGDPGGGKTTLLRYLALRHAQARATGDTVDSADALFPIYLRIGDFARSPLRHNGISAFLPSYLRGHECSTPGLADLLERRLRTGDCLVLLDGLDEITSADDRHAVVDAVTNFVTAFSRQGNRFVVTSRIAGYHAVPLPPPFEEVRLLEMDEPTIERFTDNYCPTVERMEAPEKSDEVVRRDAAHAAEAIKQSLRQSPGVRRLATTPLLLTTLILVHRARGRLPRRRMDAYVEVTEALGRTWRSVQGVPEAELPDDRMLTAWLTRLGSWLHEHRPEGSASLWELVEVLGPLWSRQHGTPWDPSILEAASPLDTDAGHGVRDFVAKVELHTGLLVERAPGRYGFPHLTFEEYYAGRALAFEGRAIDRAGNIRRRLHDPRYEEPILLALGLVGREQPEELDRLVAEAIYPAESEPHPYEHLLGWDYLFALRLLADDVPLPRETVDALLRQAVDEWLDWDGGRCRFIRFHLTLLDRLRDLRGLWAGDRLPTIFEQVAPTTDVDPPGKFCQLASLVSQFGPLQARTESILTELANSAADPVRRVEAMEALSRHTVEPQAVAAVKQLIEQMMAESSRQISDLGHPVIAGRPGGRIPYMYVVEVAFWALTNLGARFPEAADTILDFARHSEDPGLRLTAIGELSRNDALTTDIIESAENNNHLAVLMNLKKPDPRVIRRLIDLARGAERVHVRLQAASLLHMARNLPPDIPASVRADYWRFDLGDRLMAKSFLERLDPRKETKELAKILAAKIGKEEEDVVRLLEESALSRPLREALMSIVRGRSPVDRNAALTTLTRTAHRNPEIAADLQVELAESSATLDSYTHQLLWNITKLLTTRLR